MALLDPIPLEPAWQSVLESAAPRAVDPRALAVIVSRLSRRYQGEDLAIAPGDELAARLRFWFPRDIQKIALPIAELALAGALPRVPLRVLDLGAGLGAASLGLLRALAHPVLSPLAHTVASIDALDRDATALTLVRRIADAASRAGLLPTALPAIETRVADLGDLAAAERAPYHLVLIANALVEISRHLPDEDTRAVAIADALERFITAAPLAPDGALIAIEPATRPETRALHRARALLIERGFGVFAPCTHHGACPTLTRERDWCHEDQPVDLPPWLAPLAADAGLRWQGLTFSYLVLRRDATHSVRTLAARAGEPDWVPARLVSTPRVTKGKTEAFACGAMAPGDTGPRLMQLDRDVKRTRGSSRADRPQLAECARGDLVALAPRVLEGHTAGKAVRVGEEELGRLEGKHSAP